MNAMRMTLLVAVGVTTVRSAGPKPPTGVRVAGHVTMFEKDGAPSNDLGSAVIYLEGGEPAPLHPDTYTITTSEKEFVPRVVVIPVGSTVEFANADPVSHNVFSASEPNTFDLGKYGRGKARPHTFTAPGLARVFCNVHPRMVAFVQVMATPHYTQPAADGSFALDSVPPGHYTLVVWHERSPELAQDLTVGPAGVSGLVLQLDARGFHWVPHKNKHGQDYPTDEDFERY
ncbi:MAG TPA: carboxypeptidase regulatory-like domain-containing protein [Gemmatimonadales bacterium]|nr:carboxypeptidase regulatory-like domain-containing protein [Gemmatimonadales bacterium]